MTSNTPTKGATINDLPNELLISILEYLEFGHLIQCRLVCKRFKLLCRDAKVSELIISSTTSNFKTRWFYTNKQLNFENAISVATFNSYRSTFRLEKFRRIYFYGNMFEYGQLKLNEFTQLEQLAIVFFEPDEDDVRHELHINLPNLRMIELYNVSHRRKFFITTPKLEMLKNDYFDAINLTYVDNIKHLESDFRDESYHVLVGSDVPLIKHIRDLKLTTLSCTRGAEYHELEAIKNLIRDKFNQQRFLPKIYFLSVEIDDVKKIDEYKNHPYGYADDFLFPINNYNSLAEIVSEDTLLQQGINYNQLMKTMKGKIPEDFFKTFLNNRKVRVGEKVENLEHLYWFLKNFDYLIELNLESDPFDQSFYSQLGELDQLMVLTVEDSSVPIFTSSKLSFNFDFLLKLKLLQEFRTNFNSPNIFDVALELFTHWKLFWSMKFYFKEKEVMIYKDLTANVYDLRYDDCEKSELDFNELGREFDRIRSRHSDQD